MQVSFKAQATYQTLPKNGAASCPASGQFFHDQFCWLGKVSNTTLSCVACPDLAKSTFTPSRVIRGGFPSVDGVASLKRIGVTLILDLRTSAEDPHRTEETAAAAQGIAYFNLPMQTSSASDADANRHAVYRALGLMRYFRTKHPGALIYFHCQRGEDRTGLVGAAYRFLVEHDDRTEIEKEMKTHYFNSNYAALRDVWADLRVSDDASIIEPTLAEKNVLDRARH